MSDAPRISIIVPAINEGPNLAPLAEQIDAALSARPGGGGAESGQTEHVVQGAQRVQGAFEVIVVDDGSTDETPRIAAQLARRFPWFRHIVRDNPKDGLSGAVLRGFTEARGEYLVVMDADLQHPPDKLRELLDPIERGESEFALGSRYVPGGSTAEKWGVFREINSRVATFLARPFAGRTTDPMSGFFALRRSTYERAQRLTPLGYKIGLELMCKCRVRDVREIPIHFAERARGESKLTLHQQFRYLEHLSRLYDFTFPRASPVVKFLIVLAVSWLAALGVFHAMLGIGAASVKSVAIAYLFAMGVTAVFHLRYVRTQREFLARPHPWSDFALISAAEYLACVLAAIWVTKRIDRHTLLDLFVIPFFVATVVRYVLRKELLQDVRGLRREVRREELS